MGSKAGRLPGSRFGDGRWLGGLHRHVPALLGAPVLWYNLVVPDALGRFQKGEHWRERGIHWDRDWLYCEYVTKSRSASDIATDAGCTENNILYWLAKHGIPRRAMREIRAKKTWGLRGASNGMYGQTGDKNPRWKGGCTPERQAFYSSPEWVDAVKSVWSRDRGVCRECGVKSSRKDAHHIHHIASFRFKETRCDLANLVLLCPRCHRWVHSRRNIERKWLANV